MERISPFSFISSSSYTPVIATAFCCLFVFFLVRLSFSSPTIIPRKTRSKKSSSSSSDGAGGGGRGSCCSNNTNNSDSLTISCTTNGKIEEINLSAGGEGLLTTGSSMMEQLVPEIMTHTLSYLDYRSLCRLSMTNSSMRREANDDNAWKLIYHKDFTAEQDSVTPPNGWKAYYAATRAVVTVNAAFYEIIRERSLPAMGHFWLNADYVQCVHGSGDLFTGYDAVIQSWHGAFNWAESDASQIRDVRVRVLSDMAWVTMKAYDDMEEAGPFHVTNVYEFHKGQWYMVHHHSSLDERLDQ